MAIFGKNKNVRVTPTFTIVLDKGDSTFTSYALKGDRDKCVTELEKGANWGIDSLELENEPPKDNIEASKVKVKSIKLLTYPKTTKGHQDSGVYKYYVDSPTRGAGSKDRLWLESCKTEISSQSYAGCNKTTKIHEIKINIKVSAKVKILPGH
jgi:hypothetical protein